MGCDGGTIPTRDELVKTRKKPEQKDKNSVRQFKWRQCSLSQQRLVKPVMACELGRMYNKEAVLEKLLNDKTGGDHTAPGASADHIKSLKDVRELQLVDNPSFDPKSWDGPMVGDSYVDEMVAPWICPISGIEMNGKFKFSFDWSDGRVFSDKGLKFISNDDHSKVDSKNIVVINPEENSQEEIDNKTSMLERRAKAKLEKKAAKEAKKRGANEEVVAAADPEKPSTSKKVKTSDQPTTAPKISNGNSSKSKLTTASVQADPTKSDIFKSIFSSHSSAKNKPKSHWVTFDPRYN